MVYIVLNSIVGPFAENKDIARGIRLVQLFPAVERSEEICLDFEDVDSTTQSFIHALISDIFQKSGDKCLNLFEFKNCNSAVESIITTVINYSLED